ncbi:MAG: hypothetical protein JNL62_01625 [Bryobacterales bacterium]|nr:hypothetical protein [Bryobacterales bacterium]
MRRLTGLALLLLLAACKTPERVRVTHTMDSEPGLKPIVHVADPQTAQQLVRGFHALEGNAWRWTKGSFAVTLKPPRGADKEGAYLVVRLSVAESTIQHLGSVKLTATVNGTALEGETYTKNGDYMYKRDVPGAALTGDAVTVEFALDKFLEAGKVEGRELGIIVAMVGLESKAL